MTRVFVVTKGIYSDRHVEGAYSSLELAKQAIDNAVAAIIKEQGRNYKYIRDEYQITSWNMDGELENSSAFWLVEYTPEADIRSHWWCEVADVGENEPNFVSVRKANRLGAKINQWSVFVYADNRDAALKIANEKIMMAIAGGM